MGDGTGLERRMQRKLAQKEAQQRYRHRKKCRLAELQVELQKLAKEDRETRRQTTALSRARTELETKVAALEAQLAQRKTETAALRQTLLMRPAPAVRKNPAAAQQPRPQRARRCNTDVDLSTQGALRSWLSNKEARSLLACAVAALRMFLEEHSLRPCLSHGGPPRCPELLERLLGPLDACRALCMRVPRGSDSQMVFGQTDMGQKQPAKAASPQAPTARGERWLRTLHALQLTPVQRENLLTLRGRQLAKLVRLTSERRVLSMQAMAMMLPTLPQPACSGCTLDGKIAAVVGDEQNSGVSGVLEENAEVINNRLALEAVLDDIQDTLSMEQRTMLDMDFLVMHRVLDPVQCAVFIVDTYPDRPDGLRLAQVAAHSQAVHGAHAMLPLGTLSPIDDSMKIGFEAAVVDQLTYPGLGVDAERR